MNSMRGMLLRMGGGPMFNDDDDDNGAAMNYKSSVHLCLAVLTCSYSPSLPLK